jgi:hypothetical protein
VIYAVAEDVAEAAQAAKEDILFYLGYPEIDPLLEHAGFMAEAETIRRAKLGELLEAGLDLPIIRVSNVPYAEREKKQVFLRAIDSLRHF